MKMEAARGYLFSIPLNMPCGAGEDGESVYGEKADDMPPDGEGNIGLFAVSAAIVGAKGAATVSALQRLRELELRPRPTAAQWSCRPAVVLSQVDAVERRSWLRSRVSRGS